MTTLQLFLSIGLPVAVSLLALCATIIVGLLFNRRIEQNLREDLKQMEIRLTAAITAVETRLAHQITTLGDRLLAVERKTGTR